MLGAGVTRIWRSEYPANFGGTLAMIITPERSEIGEQHQLVIKVMEEDGKELAKVERGFRVDGGEPGDFAAIPLVMPFAPPISLPKAGRYSIVVLVNSTQEDYLGFTAMPAGSTPG